MDITTRRWERVDMVKVVGRVDHQTAPELEKALRSILDGGRHNIVVDMSEISYISSAGLKVLQAMAKAARGGVRPGDVRLVGLSPNLVDVFHTIGLDQFFKIYTEPVEAVGSF